MVAPEPGGIEALGPVARTYAGVSIKDVDDELEALMMRAVNPDPRSTNRVRVDFDAPTKEWRQEGGQTPRVNAYLYDIRQDPIRKQWGRVDVKRPDERGRKDDQGRRTVVEQRLDIPRWFRLSYLITAWATSYKDEHDVLTQLLRILVARDTLPLGPEPPAPGRGDPRRGEDGRLHLPIAVGMPPPQDRAISDVWSAMGVEQKPSLDLMVSIPVVPADIEDRMKVGMRPSEWQEVGDLTTVPPRFEFGHLLAEREEAEESTGTTEEPAAATSPAGPGATAPDGWRRRVRQGVVARRETTEADTRGGRPVDEERADRARRPGDGPED